VIRCATLCLALLLLPPTHPTSKGRAAVSNYYYILGHERHTYQAPSLHAAITARLQRSMHHVREGFKRFKVSTWAVQPRAGSPVT
jgi:hypothetical protein